MPHSRPRGFRCLIPGCYNLAWVERDLLICGGHAREVLDRMRQEVNDKAKCSHDAEIQTLKRILREQSDKIINLRRALNPPSTEQPSPTPDLGRTDNPGVVYYLRSGGYIKIGWASNLTRRMKAYPPDSLLLATEPGTRKDEYQRHRKFAVHRTHGREWYAMVPPLMHHIERVKAEHGAPDPVAFAARPVQVPRPYGRRG